MKNILFLVQKRAFKVFKKELNHDIYSSKKLLEKCFFSNIKSIVFEKESFEYSSLYDTHIGFWFDFSSLNLGYCFNSFKLCIHCGMVFF